MKTAIIAAVLILSSLTAAAQTVDVFAREIEATREGTTHVHGGAATVHLNRAWGLEGGADVFWSERISSEFSVSSVRHDLDASAFGQSVDLGSTRETAVNALLNLHASPHGTFDAWVGAGASFVRFDDLSDTAELTTLGVHSIHSIHFHDKVVPLINAGASYRVNDHWALTANAKWYDVKSRTTATYADTSSEGAQLDLTQITFGAGLAYRF